MTTFPCCLIGVRRKLGWTSISIPKDRDSTCREQFLVPHHRFIDYNGENWMIKGKRNQKLISTNIVNHFHYYRLQIRFGAR